MKDENHGVALRFSILYRLIASDVRTLRWALGGTVPLTTPEASLHAGTARQGRGGVTPLDPESPHAYWLRQNRAAFADAGVATPALVAPHPWVDWRGELVVFSWFCNEPITNYHLPITTSAPGPRKSSCLLATAKPCSLRGLGRCDARARCTASLCRLARRASGVFMVLQ
jgi:hypothetical protein